MLWERISAVSWRTSPSPMPSGMPLRGARTEAGMSTKRSSMDLAPMALSNSSLRALLAAYGSCWPPSVGGRIGGEGKKPSSQAGTLATHESGVSQLGQSVQPGSIGSAQFGQLERAAGAEAGVVSA